MKLLITGGAGFIGSALIRYIIQHTQDSVVNLDKLTYAGNLQSLASVSGDARYVFEQADICDGAALTRIFQTHQPDAVMHLAAESHVDRSIDGPAQFMHTNIIGTYTLLEAARQYWNALEAQKKARFRFHHISTDEVYGDLPHPNDYANESNVESVRLPRRIAPRSDEEMVIASEAKQSLPLFTESAAYAPSSPYSASKASSDHLVRAWHRTYGLPIVITNCSNNYGPYHFPEKLIPLVILNALEGKPLPVYGQGDQIRDWLYVEDHARALYQVVTKGVIGETYNIGGHNEKQNIEVVRAICHILDELRPVSENPAITSERLPRHTAPRNNTKSDIVSTSLSVIASEAKQSIQRYEDLITFVQDRPGHDRRYAIDASKIQRELGWTPQESFETGLRKTVQWYLDNQAWCKNVQDGSYQRQRLGIQQ